MYKVQNLGGFSQVNPAFLNLSSKISWILWYLVSIFVVNTPIPGSLLRILLLRLFGAKLGRNCIIKPLVKVKHPWLLRMGENSWLGEGVIIDNIFPVVIGSSTCISQNVYICSGNHNFRSPSFEYIKQTITIHGQCWICASSTIAPGSRINRCTVVGIGSIVKGNLLPYSIYFGNPLRLYGSR